MAQERPQITPVEIKFFSTKLTLSVPLSLVLQASEPGCTAESPAYPSYSSFSCLSSFFFFPYQSWPR